MENRTQPILCCVGADVAGEPTQFLMERAASAGHLDWHVITVEVTSDQLAKAWGGMDVMRFQAVRFFPTHQVNAMQLVTEPSADDLFIGGITSALRLGDKWTMWHNSGPAMLELIASRVKWNAAICWVHGSNAQTRSFLVACRANPPRHIFWTGAGLAPSAEAEASAIPDVLSSLPLTVVPPAGEIQIIDLLTSTADESNPFSAIVHVGDMESSHLDLLLAHQPDHECALAIVSAAPVRAAS